MTKVYESLLKSYAQHALAYDRRWRYYNDATLRATVEAVPWERLGRVLDVACGTGLLEDKAQHMHPQIRMVGVVWTSEFSPLLTSGQVFTYSNDS